MTAAQDRREIGFSPSWALAIGVAGAAGIVLVFLLFRYADIPIARFADHQFDSVRGIFRLVAIAAGVPFFVVLLLCAVSGRALRFIPAAVTICARLGVIAAILAFVLNDYLLKPVFGRADIQTWKMGGGAGFHFFHSGPGYASFPSGHMAVAGAVLSIIAILQPGWRRMCGLIAALIAAALIIAQWHFASDILAGAMVGSAVGAGVIAARNALARWRKRPNEELAEDIAAGAA